MMGRGMASGVRGCDLTTSGVESECDYTGVIIGPQIEEMGVA